MRHKQTLIWLAYFNSMENELLRFRTTIFNAVQLCTICEYIYERVCVGSISLHAVQITLMHAITTKRLNSKIDQRNERNIFYLILILLLFEIHWQASMEKKLLKLPHRNPFNDLRLALRFRFLHIFRIVATAGFMIY